MKKIRFLLVLILSMMVTFVLAPKTANALVTGPTIVVESVSGVSVGDEIEVSVSAAGFSDECVWDEIAFKPVFDEDVLQYNGFELGSMFDGYYVNEDGEDEEDFAVWAVDDCGPSDYYGFLEGYSLISTYPLYPCTSLTNGEIFILKFTVLEDFSEDTTVSLLLRDTWAECDWEECEYDYMVYDNLVNAEMIGVNFVDGVVSSVDDQSATTITVGDISTPVLAGASIDIPVTVSNNAGFADFTGSVVYDSNVLTPASPFITKGSAVPSHMSLVANTGISLNTAEDNVTVNGELLVLHFTINSNVAVNQTQVSLKRQGDSANNFTDIDGEPVAVKFVAGTILIDATAAAKIGSKEYKTVEAALKELSDNQTLVLMKDYQGKIELKKSVTLDLNGHTLSNTGDSALRINGTDAKKAFTVNVTSSVAGGKITSDVSSYSSGTVYVDHTQGWYNSPVTTVNFDSSNVTVENTATSNGYLIYSSDSTYGCTYIHITAGNFVRSSVCQSLAGVYVNGGTYNFNPAFVASSYSLADNEYITDNGNGTYTVASKDMFRVNGKNYKFFDLAVAQAGDGDTITLLENYHNLVNVPYGKNVKLDLNGHNIMLYADVADSSYFSGRMMKSIFIVDGKLELVNSSDTISSIKMNVRTSNGINAALVKASNSIVSKFVVNTDKVTFEVEKGDFNNGSVFFQGYNNSTIQNIVINGGTYLTDNSNDILGYVSSNWNGKVLVNGGTFNIDPRESQYAIISDECHVKVDLDTNYYCISKHTWGNPETTVVPSEGVAGEITYHCSGCTATKKVEPLVKVNDNTVVEYFGSLDEAFEYASTIKDSISGYYLYFTLLGDSSYEEINADLAITASKGVTFKFNGHKINALVINGNLAGRGSGWNFEVTGLDVDSLTINGELKNFKFRSDLSYDEPLKNYTIKEVNYNTTSASSDFYFHGYYVEKLNLANGAKGKIQAYDGTQIIKNSLGTDSVQFNVGNSSKAEDNYFGCVENYTTEDLYEVNGVQYKYFYDAHKAANDGDTIKLLANVNSPISIYKSITLDLNGYTVSQFNNNGYPCSLLSAVIVYKGAKVTITSSKAGAKISVNDRNYGPIHLESFYYNPPGLAIVNISSDNLTLENTNTVKGVLLSGSDGIGEFHVTGGNFVTSGSKSSDTYFYLNNAIINGGTFNIDPSKDYYGSSSTVYLNSVPHGAVTNNGNGTYTVTTKDLFSVDGTKYKFFSDAVLAANGKTIKLEEDYSGFFTISNGENIKLDLNGHNVSFPASINAYCYGISSNLFTVNGTLEITNSSNTQSEITCSIGKISSTTYYPFNVSSTGNLTLSGNIKVSNESADGHLFCLTADNKVTINGGYYKGIITYVYQSSSYDWDLSKWVYTDNYYKVIVTGGTFTEDITSCQNISMDTTKYHMSKDLVTDEVTVSEHKYTGAITTDPTCLEKGVQTFTCSCGDSYTEEVEALDHNYVDHICTRCGVLNDSTKFFFEVSSENKINMVVGDDYNLVVRLPEDGNVNTESISLLAVMQHVESLGVSGVKSHSITINTGFGSKTVNLETWLSNAYGFGGGSITANIDGKEVTYSFSKNGLKIYGNTDEDKARAAWQALTSHITSSEQNTDDSFIEIANGSYLMIGTELLRFEDEYEGNLLLNDFSNLSGLEAAIREAVMLDTCADQGGSIKVFIKAGTKIAVGSTVAALDDDYMVEIVADKDEMTNLYGSLSAIRSASGSYDVTKKLVDLFNEVIYVVDACDEINVNMHEHSLVHHDRLEATCEVDGNVEYWECSECGRIYADSFGYEEIASYVIDATDHNYGTPTYTWDGANCTATRTCGNDASHKLTETKQGTYVKDTDATCTTNEFGHYEVTFDDAQFGSAQTAANSVEKADSATDHNYGTPAYAWDGANCTATRTCGNDAAHKLTETKQGSYVKDTDATCTANEFGHYEVTFDDTQFGLAQTAANSVEKADTAINHNYGTPTYSWDGANCTATRTCANDQTHKLTESKQGTYVKDTDATCTTNEFGHYEVTFDDTQFGSAQTAANSVEKADTAINHNYQFVEIVWTNYTAVAKYECANDQSHKDEHNCTITFEVTKAPTCTQTGVKVYTATYDGHTDTKNETLEINPNNHSLTHHDLKYPTLTANGNVEYWVCSECGGYYLDAAGANATNQEGIVLTLEEAQVLSANELNNGADVLLMNNTNYTYTFTKPNKSVSQQFLWEVASKSTDQYRVRLQNYFLASSNYVYDNSAWFVPDQNALLVYELNDNKNNFTTFGNAGLTVGVHEIIFNTQAILNNGTATGKYLVTVLIDGVLKASVVNNYDASKMTSKIWINSTQRENYLYDIDYDRAAQDTAIANANVINVTDLVEVGIIKENSREEKFSYTPATQDYSRIFKFNLTMPAKTSTSELVVDLGTSNSCRLWMQAGSDYKFYFGWDVNGHWTDYYKFEDNSNIKLEPGRTYSVEMGRVRLTNGKDMMFLKIDGKYLYRDNSKPSWFYVDPTASNGKPIKTNQIGIKACGFVITDVNYSDERNYESPDIISVNDLKYAGAYQNGQIALTSNHEYQYTATTQYGSVIFKGVINLISGYNGSQLRFFPGWSTEGVIWLNSGLGTLIPTSKVSDGYQYGPKIATGKDVNMEYGRLAILDEQGKFTGKFYIYLKADGVILNQYISSATTDTMYKSHTMFITGSDKNGESVIKNVNIEKTVKVNVGTYSEDVTVQRSSKMVLPSFSTEVLPTNKTITGWVITGTETAFNPTSDRVFDDLSITAIVKDLWTVKFGTEETIYVDGATINAPTTTPTKDYDQTYHYEFAGWVVKGTETLFASGTTASANVEYEAKFNAITHTFGNWETDQDATCTVDGSKHRTCACGCVEEGTIPALQHNYEFSEIVWTNFTAKAIYVCKNDSTHTEEHDCTVTSVITTPATCEGLGLRTYTATYDGHSDDKTEDIPAINHNYKFSEIVWTNFTAKAIYVCENDSTHTEEHDCTVINAVTTPATCEAKGERTYMASYDGHSSVKTEEISALQHNYEFKEIVWTNFTAKAVYVCANDKTHTQEFVCDITDEVTTTATCSVDGIKTYTASYDGHSDTKTENLGKNPNNHDIEHHDAKAPTCTEVGWDAYDTCKDCEYSTYVEKSAINHNYEFKEIVWTNYTAKAVYVCANDNTHTQEFACDITDEVTTIATCSVDGIKTYTATYDGHKATKTENLGKNPNNHDIEHHDAKAPTCTEIGWDAYDTCKNCDYTTYVEKAALQHNYEFKEIVWTNFTAKAVYVCANDNTHVVEYDCEVSSAVTTTPTCSVEGIMTYTASYDGHKSAKTENIGKDSKCHEVVHHEGKAPTCTEIGYDAYDTCKNCDYTTYVEKAALSHDLVHHDAKAPTCTEVGWDAYDTCSRCEYSTYVEKPALQHNYEFSEIVWDGFNAKAVYVCANDSNHKEEYNCLINVSIQGFATCTEAGSILYTASYDGHTSTKVETIAARSHDYQFKSITWDGLTATATFVCSHDPSHVVTYTCEVTSKVTKEAQVGVAGVMTYTATYDGHSVTLDVEIPALEGNKSVGCFSSASISIVGAISLICGAFFFARKRKED